MNKISAIFIAFGALVLMACGGDGAGDNGAGSTSEKAVEYELYAEDVHTAEDAMKLYASRMNQIAGAIEQIEKNADADRAAKMILDSANEYELLEARLDELGRNKLASDLAARSGGYMDMYTRQYTEAQTRLAAAIQKVAEKDPRIMLKLSRAMQKLNANQPH